LEIALLVLPKRIVAGVPPHNNVCRELEMGQELENALDQPGTLANMLAQLAINLEIVVSVISIPLTADGVITMESKDATTYLGSAQLQAWEDAKRSLLALVKIITLVILA